MGRYGPLADFLECLDQVGEGLHKPPFRDTGICRFHVDPLATFTSTRKSGQVREETHPGSGATRTVARCGSMLASWENFDHAPPSCGFVRGACKRRTSGDHSRHPEPGEVTDRAGSGWVPHDAPRRGK